MSAPSSDKRLAANRANAARSTGPRTEAGKLKSRANALTHGLCATVVPVEDDALVRERTIGVHETFKPQNSFQAWVCVIIAIITIRLDRLRELERQIRQGASWRASHHWDDDQRREANRIGGRLSSRPDQVVGQLRRSAHGCDWLIERWERLASIADRGGWTDEQKALANDLLGTPRELRADAPGFTVDADGRMVDTGINEAALAREQLAELNLHRERISEADEIARRLAIADLDDFNNRDLIRLQRYERSLRRELHRLCELSQFESPHAAPHARFMPSVPAHGSDPLAVPNEPISEPSSLVPNEPTLAATLTLPNEPTLAAIIPALSEDGCEVSSVRSNEPTQPESALVPNEPTAPASRPARLTPGGISPELLALLEADLPDPDTLDPAWCRALLADTLGFDESGRYRVPDAPGPIGRQPTRIEAQARGTLADPEA